MADVGHTAPRSALSDLAAPQAMDRLGLLTLLSGLYFFQFWSLQLGGGGWPAPVLSLLVALSALQILLPRLSLLFLVNAGAFVAHYAAFSPIASNNQITALFFCLTVLVAALVVAARRGRASEDRDNLFLTIAGPGRWLLAIMYFYGIYHKINIDFLDPAVSCAVVLYGLLAGGFGLADWGLGQYGAIAATFIVEGIAMVLLFVPRWKVVGMAIGVPFHVIIGWTGYAYYKDFSTIVLVLYTLFIPAAALSTGFDRLSRLFGSRETALSVGRMAIFGLLTAFAVVSFWRSGTLAVTHASFTWVFTVYAIVFYVFLLLCVRPAPGEAQPKAGLLAVLPILFFINGASPYLGLKTESSIAMYSNLHTEGGQTNHLIHGTLPFAAGYQEDLVVPIGSNSAAFNESFVYPGSALVRYELDRMLALTPGLNVIVEVNGARVETAAGWTNTYLASGPLTQSFLMFKPVDFNRPKACSH
ncbi:MAG: thiol-disulfide oxidoreductase [Pseudomonadota bacterium]